MYEKVLVPLDGSPLSESVIPHAEEIAAKFGSELLLLRVVPTLTGLMAETLPQSGLQTAGVEAELGVEVAQKEYESERANAGQYLDAIAGRFTARGLKVQLLILEGAAGRAILEAAQENAAGLIAMSTRSRRGLARSVLGSVADEVVRESHLPVLLIHPQS
jgi:nucleotide-binding universal stress UspA family protein